MTLDEAKASAIGKFVEIAVELAKRAGTHEDTATRLMDKVVVLSFLCELPGDMPLRAYCFPNVLSLHA